MAPSKRKTNPNVVALATVNAKDQRWLSLKAWITQQLAGLANPRVSDIISQGKRLGLRAKEVRTLLQMDMPEYRTTTSKVFQSQRKSRLYNSRVLGVYSCDIAFFGKIRPEMARISASYLAGALLCRDITSRYVIAEPLQHGRSAESIKAAFLRVFEKHEKKHSHPIRAILFDGESGVKSLTVRAMLAKRNISLHIFEYSKIKSAHSEGLIKHLRAAFQRVRLQDGSDREWHQIMDRIVDATNAQDIIINNVRMNFSANDINNKTLGKFFAALEKLSPVYLYSHFSIDTEMLDYRYAIGTYVALKMKAISTNVHDKRSEIAVDSEEWIIVRHVAYLSSRMQVVRCYVIESLSADKNQIVAPEDSLVQIEPPSQYK